MELRENILRAVTHRHPEHVPYEFSLTPTMMDKFRKWAGLSPEQAADLNPHFQFESWGCGPDASDLPAPDYRGYYDDPPDAAHIDGFGVARVPGTYYHFTHTVSPLARHNDPAVARSYPMPERKDPKLWASFPDKVSRIHAAGRAATFFAGHIFETGWQVRGMEQMLEEFVTEGEVSRILLERIAEDNAVAAGFAARGGIDILCTGDDVGTQHGLMMSPTCWRRWLKPLLAEVIASARAIQPDIPVWYHSDGKIEAILPDLIEVGVTILNPVQPECMDPVAIKKKVGKALAFWGGIGTQSTMPWGKPEDVRRAVKGLIDMTGREGGLVIAPTHVLEPEVPWENVLALVEATQEFGKF